MEAPQRGDHQNEVKSAELALKQLLSRVQSVKSMLQEDDERVEEDRRREEKTQLETTYEKAGLLNPLDYYQDIELEDSKKESKYQQASEDLLQVPATPRMPADLEQLLAGCSVQESFGNQREEKRLE